MTIKSIPKRLLIHSIEYEEFIGSGTWDDEFAEPITINNVRVESVSRLNRTGDSEGEQVSHVVFVDRRHSSSFPSFKIRSRIKFQGVSREVVDVKPFYGFDSEPHHYEIELK